MHGLLDDFIAACRVLSRGVKLPPMHAKVNSDRVEWYTKMHGQCACMHRYFSGPPPKQDL